MQDLGDNPSMATRSYAGVSAAQRRAERRNRLLEATLDVAGSEGYEGLSVSRLCRIAGLNDRYFYEHFADRQAVFDALVERLAAETLAVMTEAIAAAGADSRQVVHSGLSACINLLTGDPRKARVVFVESPAHNSNAHRSQIRDMFITLMRAQAMLQLGGAIPDTLEFDLKFAGIHLFGALMECTTSWLAGDLAISRSELIEHCTRLLLAVTSYTLDPDRGI